MHAFIDLVCSFVVCALCMMFSVINLCMICVLAIDLLCCVSSVVEHVLFITLSNKETHWFELLLDK